MIRMVMHCSYQKPDRQGRLLSLITLPDGRASDNSRWPPFHLTMSSGFAHAHKPKPLEKIYVTFKSANSHIQRFVRLSSVFQESLDVNKSHTSATVTRQR